MKIEQKIGFQPIVLEIESEAELKRFQELVHAAYVERAGEIEDLAFYILGQVGWPNK